MDLAAYMQIGDLEQIAKENGIEIPRLRGYRLMKDQKPMSVEEIHKMAERQALEEAEQLCCAYPTWNPYSHTSEYSWRTDCIRKKYIIYDYSEGYKKPVTIRWNRIHGKKRKILKWQIRKAKRRIQNQYEVWNKYCGREDVLYIHSRMGGGNWYQYEDKQSITSAPWFLDRVDDYWDGTYCDFYARINV